jgi:hypothetical protein
MNIPCIRSERQVLPLVAQVSKSASPQDEKHGCAQSVSLLISSQQAPWSTKDQSKVLGQHSNGRTKIDR